jgi:hypothetical protein
MPINKGLSKDTTYNHTTKGAKEKRNKREIFGFQVGLRPEYPVVLTIKVYLYGETIS